MLYSELLQSCPKITFWLTNFSQKFVLCDAVVFAPWPLLVVVFFVFFQWCFILLTSIFPTCGYFCRGPSRLPKGPVLLITSCSAGVGVVAGACASAVAGAGSCSGAGIYPCGYLHGGRVKESDGECCSQGGEGGAGPPARVRPTSACPVPRRRSSPWAQTHRRRAGPPGSQARRRRSGPPVLGLLWGRGVQFYFFRWGLHFNGP